MFGNPNGLRNMPKTYRECEDLWTPRRAKKGWHTLAGNTTMAHLLLQIEPRYIRRDPYIPTVADFPILKAGEIGIRANKAAP